MRRRQRGAAVLLGIFLLAAALSGWGVPAMAAEEPAGAVTMLYGEAVSPFLIPGETDDTVQLRWASKNSKPVTIHYGVVQPGETEPETVETMEATVSRAAYARYFANETYFFHGVLPQRAGETYAYALAEPGTEPTVWYPIAGEQDGRLTVFFTADSHLSNAGQVVSLDQSIQRADDLAGVELICHSGDLNENTDSWPEVMIANSEEFRTKPVAVVTGNHDYPGILYEYFHWGQWEKDEELHQKGKRQQDYSFVKENVLFVGLNIKAGGAVADHGDYLRMAVAEHPDVDWTVVLIHYSMFSNGSHGRDRIVIRFQRELAPVFEELDVDLVLSGHDHEYDRSMLISGGEAVVDSDGARVEKSPGEVMYISLPTATGTKFYKRVTAVNPEPAAEALKFEAGFVVASFREEAIRLRVYGENSSPVDAVMLLRKDAKE